MRRKGGCAQLFEILHSQRRHEGARAVGQPIGGHVCGCGGRGRDRTVDAGEVGGLGLAFFLRGLVDAPHEPQQVLRGAKTPCRVGLAPRFLGARGLEQAGGQLVGLGQRCVLIGKGFRNRRKARRVDPVAINLDFIDK